MTIEMVSAEQWAWCAENVHRAVFGTIRPRTKDRIDFALLALDPGSGKPCAYVTAREHDSETLYWQFGGALPESSGRVRWEAFRTLADYCKHLGYSRINARIKNTNTAMLKPAMKLGFRIIGVRNSGGDILLEHMLELGG